MAFQSDYQNKKFNKVEKGVTGNSKYIIIEHLKLVESQSEEIWQRRKYSIKSLDKSPLFILREKLYVEILNQSSCFSASSDPLWSQALSLWLKTRKVTDFPSDFIKFTLWHFEPGHSQKKAGSVQGGLVWRKQQGLTKLRKQHRHQIGIKPHCGGWMCLIVFAGESGRKREEKQEACDVWSQPDCAKKMIFLFIWIQQDTQDVRNVISVCD